MVLQNGGSTRCSWNWSGSRGSERTWFWRRSTGKLGPTLLSCGSIRPEAPAHAGDGKIKWTLEITADLAGSRDVTLKKPIAVTRS